MDCLRGVGTRLDTQTKHVLPWDSETLMSSPAVDVTTVDRSDVLDHLGVRGVHRRRQVRTR